MTKAGEPIKTAEPQLWEIRPSRGGRGLFATQDLPTGTLILLEMPALTLRRPTNLQSLSNEVIQKAFDTMTPANQKRFMQLSSSGHQDKTTEISRIFHTNALSAGDTLVKYLCFDLSLMNHSCMENASWAFRFQTGKFFVTPIRDIRKDEEITISYAGYSRWFTGAQRAVVFKRLWSFDCDCKACRSGTEYADISDMRRVLLLALHVVAELITTGTAGYPPNYLPALQESGGDCHFNVRMNIIKQLKEADLTFIWWLMAKLLEAEGKFNDYLELLYTKAVDSLQKRLIHCGLASKRVENVEAWFANIKVWTKRAQDIKRVNERPDQKFVYTPRGQESWTRSKVRGVQSCRSCW